jgi:protein-L-isoaspartate O-methyltransferase
LKGATKCLDIGFGSGFMSAAMRLLMTDIRNSLLFGVDHIRDFVAIAEDNFDRYLIFYKNIKSWGGRFNFRL